MLSYYTVLITLCWMALGVLCVLVHENSWIPQKDKHRFYLTYGIIALSALAEWLGIQLSGNTDVPAWVLMMVKCFDYILTPMAGGAVVAQMKLHNRWYKALMVVLGCNSIFQIVACFNGWMIVVDDQHRYSHGPLYGVYIGIYLAVIALTAVEFLIFGLSYRKQNKVALISVFLMLLFGIALQEILGSEYRTAYIAMTICVSLMFIHYAEFYKMDADEQISQQHTQLMKDVLTGVFSRYAYTKDIERYSQMTALPDNFTVFVFDINRLKTVNDTIGHDAGDEMIVGAARSIEKVIGDVGRCYRTGGDEFVVMTNMTKEQTEEILTRLAQETEGWSKNRTDFTLSIAPGYARAEDYRDYTIEELVKKAD